MSKESKDKAKAKDKTRKPPPTMGPVDERAWKKSAEYWESQGGLAGFWKAVEDVKAGAVNDDPFAEFVE